MNDAPIKHKRNCHIRDLVKEINIFSRPQSRPNKIREVIFDLSAQKKHSRDVIQVKTIRFNRSQEQKEKTNINFDISLDESSKKAKIYRKPMNIPYSQHTCPIRKGGMRQEVKMYGVNTVRSVNSEAVNNISVISERTKSSVMKEIERKGVDINFDPKNKKRPMEILPYESFSECPTIIKEENEKECTVKEEIKGKYIVKKDSVYYTIYEKKKQKLSDYMMKNGKRNKTVKNRGHSFDFVKRKYDNEMDVTKAKYERSVEKNRGGKVDLNLCPSYLHATRNKRTKYFDIIRSIVTFGKYEFMRLFDLKKQLRNENELRHYSTKVIFIQRWWKEIYYRYNFNVEVMIIQKNFRGYVSRKRFNKFVENKLFGEVLENLEEFMRNKKIEIVFRKINEFYGKKIKIDRMTAQSDYYLSKMYYSSEMIDYIVRIQTNLRKYIFQRKNKDMMKYISEFRKNIRIPKKVLVNDFFIKKRTYSMTIIQKIILIEKIWREYHMKIKEVIKKPIVNTIHKVHNEFTITSIPTNITPITKKLLRPFIMSKLIYRKIKKIKQRNFISNKHLFTKHHIDLSTQIDKLILIQKTVKAFLEQRQKNLINMDNTSNSLLHSHADSSSFTTKSTVFDKKQVIDNIKLMQGQSNRYKTTKAKSFFETNIKTNDVPPMKSPLIEATSLTKINISNSLNKVLFIQRKIKKQNIVKLPIDYKESNDYISKVSKRENNLRQTIKIPRLSIKSSEIDFDIANEQNPNDKYEINTISQSIYPKDLIIKARNKTTSKQYRKKSSIVISKTDSFNTKLKKMFLLDIKNKLSIPFIAMYNRMKLFYFLYLFTQRVIKSSQEFSFNSLRCYITNNSSVIYRSSCSPSEISHSKETFYFSTLRRHLSIISDKSEVSYPLIFKVKLFLQKNLPLYFKASHNKKIIPYLTSEQQSNLEKTNIFNVNEYEEMGRYINLCYQKEMNLRKGSLNNLIQNRIKRTKFVNTNIFTITRFMDKLFQDITKSKFCHRCYCKKEEKCKGCFCHEESDDEPEFEVENNIIKIEEYQSTQNKSVYTFSSSSEEDKSNNDIDISGLNMRPQLTERTSRDRPLFVKITKINKEDEDDIDIFANIKSEKTNKTLNNDINNAIRIVKSRNNHSAYKQCNTSYSNENVIKLGRSPNELSKYKSRINHLLTQKKKKEFIQLRDHSEDKDNFA